MSDYPNVRGIELTILISSLLIFAACSGSVHAQESETACAVPDRTDAGRAFYVDPVRGSMANDGSRTAPWSTLHDVLARHLVSTATYATPFKPGGVLNPPPPSVPIHAGDTIYLRSGDHGDVVLHGINDKFITIAAEPGQHPVIDRLAAQGTSKWILRGLTFRNHGGWLVQLRSHDFYGPNDNIILERDTLYSEADVSAWSAAEWRLWVASGIYDGATCSILRSNRIFNVGNAINVNAPHSIVAGNMIENFGDDGIDFTSSAISIVDNFIADNHDIGDGNHNDGIQGWNFNPDGEKDVTIANNTLIDETSPNMSFRGTMQGISVFDGKWSNIEVLNNYIRTDTWHGISLYGARDSRIEGNTVIADDAPPTWIMVTNMKKAQGGDPPSGDIVRRNTAMRYNLPDGGKVSASDNVVLGPGTMVVPPA